MVGCGEKAEEKSNAEFKSYEYWQAEGNAQLKKYFLRSSLLRGQFVRS